ncbi:hypothetical protein Dsin_001078 [Dipteronia sinensis]|uniref:DUF4283 domain-containing protein n=1 Tax=Dipteronia sinensis TaxID=43782 RepID=A0AAE0B4F8_9ROSI|nr:hypothetical protein Dsin_001078 [Dipteronia sinensis]
MERDSPVRVLDESLENEAVTRMSICLVGEILSNKTVNSEAFMRVIGNIWHVKEGFEIESVTGNVFTFHFKSKEDRQRVIYGCHQSFNNALMVLAKHEGNGTIKSIQFHMAVLWLQIHQVPILCMTKKIGWFLGSKIGEVMEVDRGNEGETGGKFMQVMAIRLRNLGANGNDESSLNILEPMIEENLKENIEETTIKGILARFEEQVDSTLNDQDTDLVKELEPGKKRTTAITDDEDSQRKRTKRDLSQVQANSKSEADDGKKGYGQKQLQTGLVEVSETI